MNRLQKVLRGLEIFNKHGCGDIDAQHDEIFAGLELNNPEEAKELVELGWVWDESLSSWSIFT